MKLVPRWTVLLPLAVLFFNSALTETPEEEPDLYGEAEFEQNVEGEPHFIMFYAPWCGHCKNLKPIWKDLSNYYNLEQTGIISIAKVDCTQETKLCSDNGVTGYPTLKFFQPGKEPTRYSGKRDLESLKDFVKSELEKDDEKESSGPEEEDGLYELTSDNFKAHVAKGSHFIKFFAPWCGHCKRLEPVWKKLAKAHEDSNSVKIGRIDCTKEKDACREHNVKGYPTLIWFEDGKNVEQYKGGRDLDALTNFVKRSTDKQVESEKEEEEKVEGEKQPEEPEVVDGLHEMTAGDFQNLVATGDSFVKFFAPWCGHCKRMEPAWKDLAKEYEDHDVVKIGRVDCTKHSSVCRARGVKGYPTLKYFRNGQEVEGAPNGRDLENLKSFVAKMLEKDEAEQKKPEPVKEEEEEVPEAGALELNDETFKSTIESGVTFVKFYAPWCGHCKRLAPTWDQLAGEDFSDSETPIRIAKVDCTKHGSLCSEYQVRGYPTLKLFRNGDEVMKYGGSRTLEAMKGFVMENAVTPEDKEEQQQKDEL